MPASTTLVGYAMPRLVIDQLGGDEVPQDMRIARLNRGLQVLDEAVQFTKSPEELLIKFADDLRYTGDLKTLDVLKRILPLAWYEQNQAKSMLVRLKNVLIEKAPNLWDEYAALSEDDKAQNGIA